MLGSPWVIIINLDSHVCRQNNRIQTGLWGADLSYWSRAASRKMGFRSHLTALWCGRRQSMEPSCLTGLPPALNTASRDDLPTLWSTFSLKLGFKSSASSPALRVGFCLQTSNPLVCFMLIHGTLLCSLNWVSQMFQQIKCPFLLEMWLCHWCVAFLFPARAWKLASEPRVAGYLLKDCPACTSQRHVVLILHH